MTSNRWPLFGLRLRTPRLELRLPTPADLDALADLAAAGVHDEDTQPFTAAWTDAPPDQRALSTVQHHWSAWGSWKPAQWTLNLVADRDGTIVGTQGASLAVSRKHGYADDGVDRVVIRGQAAVVRRLRLDRPTWEAHRRIPVEIEGLGPCLEHFGVDG